MRGKLLSRKQSTLKWVGHKANLGLQGGVLVVELHTSVRPEREKQTE